MRLASMMALVCLLGAPVWGASKRECLAVCESEIADCTSTCGDLYGVAAKSCRAAVLKKCRREGAGFCLATTTVTSSSTTTTAATLPPITMRTGAQNITLRNGTFAQTIARVTLTIGPTRQMRLIVKASSLGYRFCWVGSGASIVQGSRQWELGSPFGSTFAMTIDDGGPTCGNLAPGVEVRGAIKGFPPSFDPEAPFRLETRADSCGSDDDCTIYVP